MAGFSVGARLKASQLNTFTPSGDVVAGGKVQATTAQTVSDRQDTSGSTSSTSYTATLTGGTACGVAFVAPTSGKVLLRFATAGFNSGANDNKSAVQVRAGGTIGSGSVVYAVNDNDMILFTGAATYRIPGFAIVTGLTAGSTYNAQMLHKVSTGTGTFLYKLLLVEPLF